jgi:hypothetical protein
VLQALLDAMSATIAAHVGAAIDVPPIVDQPAFPTGAVDDELDVGLKLSL